MRGLWYLLDACLPIDGASGSKLLLVARYGERPHLALLNWATSDEGTVIYYFLPTNPTADQEVYKHRPIDVWCAIPDTPEEGEGEGFLGWCPECESPGVDGTHSDDSGRTWCLSGHEYNRFRKVMAL